MSGVEVLGRDSAAEAYRIRTRIAGHPVTAQVPEFLMDSLRPGSRPSHQEAYEWIARNAARLQTALTALRAGRAPRPPFDLLILEEGRDDT